MPKTPSTYSGHRQARFDVGRAVMFERFAQQGRGVPSAVEQDLAMENAVSLVFASRFPDAVDLLAEEQRKAKQFRDTLHATAALLDRHGIDHIYIKFRKLYPYHDSNADVIVPAERWEQAVRLFKNAGYSPYIMFKEPDKVMFDKPGEVSVHLHPGVTWNGVSYFDTATLWSESIASTEGPWRELAPLHDFLVNLAHNLFENYEVTLGEVLFFRQFLRTWSIDLDEAERIAADQGWDHGFRRAYGQMASLLDAWSDADRTGVVPGWLLNYPYRMPVSFLAPSYGQRIVHQLRRGDYRTAGREIYAYPAFYALKRRHDLPFL